MFASTIASLARRTAPVAFRPSASVLARAPVLPSHVGARAFSSATPTQTIVPGPAKKQLTWAYVRKYYCSDSATYPIVLIISGAVVMLIFSLTRQATSNPDVKFNKAVRTDAINDQDEAVAIEHFDHVLRRHAAKQGTARVSYAINPLRKDE